MAKRPTPTGLAALQPAPMTPGEIADLVERARSAHWAALKRSAEAAAAANRLAAQMNQEVRDRRWDSHDRRWSK